MKRVSLSIIFLITLFKGFAQPCFISPATSYNIPNDDGGITHDFNLDGKPDLAILNIIPGTGSTISVLLATGNNAFSAATNYTIGTQVRQIISGDFNNDGITDIATSNRDVLLGNGIGGFSFATPTYTSSTNNTGIAAADFNNDGKTDVAITSTNQVWVILGNGSGIYTGGTFHNVGSNPRSITTNDFNGDGKIDIAVANSSSGDVSILRNTGVSFAPTVNYSVGSNLLSIATNDFNNDGSPDLAVGEGYYSNSGRVWILSGSTTGTFSIANTFGIGGQPTKLVLSDINNDGSLDILTKNSENVSVSIGSINGTFSMATNYPVPFGGPALTFDCADFNNDGKIDIALGVSSSIFIITGNGNGTFYSPISYQTALSHSPEAICTADFNNDTFKDLAIANDYNDISLLLGSSAGTFTPTTTSYTVGSLPVDIKNADFNNDGKMDLVVVNSNSNSISVLMGNGNGTFSSPVNYSTAPFPKTLYLKDFNGDNKIDIAVNENSGTISIRLGNGNGTFASPVSYLLGNTNKMVCADFNMDGILDFAGIIDNGSGDEIKTLFGNGSGAFLTSITTTIVNNSYNLLIINDFNNDSKYDIAATTISSGSSLQDIIIFKGNGNGTFSQVSSYASGGIITSFLSADFNNDGNTDLAAEIEPVAGNDGFLIFEGMGTGNFAPSTYYPYPKVAQIASDFNNDGKIDLAGVNQGSIFTTVLLNNGVTNFTLSAVTNTLCIGSSISLTAAGNGSFTWSNGAVGNSITVSPSATSTYSLTNQLTNGCSNTKTISVTVNNTCQDVWPGDANSDGAANNLDILELGLHYSQTGAPRGSTSNNWESYFANNWTGTITNGKNLNHSDCNGDGIINNNDTLAIFNNYNLTHTFKVAQTTTINPQLTIVPDQVSVLKGTWGTASIYLGDNTTNINNINGVAFTVDFDNTLIETNNLYIEYQNSFIDAGQNLHFKKLDFANGKLYTASTHTINNNVNGFGKIATLHYQIKSNLTSAQILDIGISQANKSDFSGVITPLTSGTGSLTATIDVGVQELLNDNIIFLSPNPTNDILTITSKTKLQKIELVSITGQILLSASSKSNNHILNLENYSNGIYFINIYESNKIIKREKIIVNK